MLRSQWKLKSWIKKINYARCPNNVNENSMEFSRFFVRGWLFSIHVTSSRKCSKNFVFQTQMAIYRMIACNIQMKLLQSHWFFFSICNVCIIMIGALIYANTIIRNSYVSTHLELITVRIHLTVYSEKIRFVQRCARNFIDRKYR